MLTEFISHKLEKKNREKQYKISNMWFQISRPSLSDLPSRVEQEFYMWLTFVRYTQF